MIPPRRIAFSLRMHFFSQKFLPHSNCLFPRPTSEILLLSTHRHRTLAQNMAKNSLSILYYKHHTNAVSL